MIYLTGCTGFIGRSLLQKFEQLGIKSVGISRSRCFTDLYPNHKCFQLDLLSENLPLNLFEEPNSVLIHLSWIATPGLFWNSLENDLWSIKSKALFDAFFVSIGSKVINIGSSAEYFSMTSAPIDENQKIGGQTNYGKTKSQVAQYLEEEYVNRFTHLRVFNLYGLVENSGRFIPDCIDNLSQGIPFRVQHPKQVRDFLFIDDLLITILQCLKLEPLGYLNVGTGIGTTLERVAELIGRQMGAPDLIDLLEFSSDNSSIVASMLKFNEVFPNFKTTDLETGILKSIAARRA